MFKQQSSKSRSQDSAAGSELHEKASDPLHGCGKVTEYFVCWFLIHKARMFIFYFTHSVVLVTASPLLSDSYPAPSQKGQATRYCSYKEQRATEDFCCSFQNPYCTFGPFPPLPVSLTGC